MSTSTTATTRYGMVPAPGGLVLVQDVVNTRAGGRPRQADLLDSGLEVAQQWWAGVAEEWGRATGGSTVDLAVLTTSDLPRLRALRDDVAQLLRREGFAGALSDGATVEVALNDDGQAHLSPRGGAVRWLAGAVMVEAFRAQTADTWRRLKVCRNHLCSGAFYDRSKNNSGVWHDVRTCGNVANLRASRARRRVGSSSAAGTGRSSG
jgi:hypothetical protein